MKKKKTAPKPPRALEARLLASAIFQPKTKPSIKIYKRKKKGRPEWNGPSSFPMNIDAARAIPAGCLLYIGDSKECRLIG